MGVYNYHDRVSNRDKVPKIFGKKYWSNFEYDAKFDNAIRNRKLFYLNYPNLKNVNSIPNYIINLLQTDRISLEKIGGSPLDHIEYYKDDKNYVIIISPYLGDEKPIHAYIQQGWNVYKELYCSQATTFIKLLPIKSKICK